MPAARIVVSGRVQGVGFRGFVYRLANVNGIGGEVWNRPDGKVEAFAEHLDEETLAKFCREIEGGPGEVQAVDVEAALPRGAGHFEILV